MNGTRNRIRNVKSIAYRLLVDDSGQDLIEYAMWAGLLGAGAVVAIKNAKAGFLSGLGM